MILFLYTQFNKKKEYKKCFLNVPKCTKMYQMYQKICLK